MIDNEIKNIGGYASNNKSVKYSNKLIFYFRISMN